LLPDTLPDTLPHSEDAEAAVLGAVLVDNRHLHRAQELLSPESFYSPRHRKVFRALCTLSESGAALDLVTVCDQLARQGDLEAVGGPGAVSTLTDGLPRAANVEHYAKIVREKWVLRQLARASQEILSSALRPAATTDQILDEAEKLIFRIAEDRLRSGLVPLKTVAEHSLQMIEELTQRRELITGIPTGFTDLDHMTAGLQPGDLIILAARPSVGKTTCALNMAAYASLTHGRTVGMFSLEMSHQQLFLRLLCAEAQVDAHLLRTGRIGKEDWSRIIKCYGTLVEAPFYIDDTPGMGVMEMRAKSRRLKLERGVDLLVVD